MSAAPKAAVFQGIEELSSDDCLSIARRKMDTSDLQVDSVVMKTLSDTPVGFLGDHYKVKITIRLCNEKDHVNIADSDMIDLHFFVKTKPRDPSHTLFVDTLGAFPKECDFFSILLGLLRKYVGDADDKNVSLQTPWTPNCYFANPRLIVLDDLSHHGFRILPNREAMDYEHCAVIFKTLARFHASSLIFEEKESQRLGTSFRFNEAFPHMFKETLWTYEPGNSGRKICEGGIKAMFSLIERMPQIKQQPHLYETVYTSLKTLFDDVCQLVSASSEFRNVVTHGDLWANNILFRYDPTGSKPEDARLVDFQMLRYTPPAHDFICALYLNTRREMREKYLLDLALGYHVALAAELRKYNLDVESLIPWTQFKSSLEHYHRLGILTCCMYYTNSFLPAEVATDLFANPDKFKKYILEDRSEVAYVCFDTDDVYNEMITEIIEELAEYSSTQIFRPVV